MCDEWKNHPEAFIDWMYAEGYREDADYGEYTVERIDNDKGYSPENCRLATLQEQQNNKSTNVFIEHNGERHTIADWSRMLGIPYVTMRYHCRVKGRTIDEAVRRYIPKRK